MSPPNLRVCLPIVHVKLSAILEAALTWQCARVASGDAKIGLSLHGESNAAERRSQIRD